MVVAAVAPARTSAAQGAVASERVLHESLSQGVRQLVYLACCFAMSAAHGLLSLLGAARVVEAVAAGAGGAPVGIDVGAESDEGATGGPELADVAGFPAAAPEQPVRARRRAAPKVRATDRGRSTPRS